MLNEGSRVGSCKVSRDFRLALAALPCKTGLRIVSPFSIRFHC